MGRKYSVNVSLIDEQHKKLFEIINKAIAAKQHSNNSKEIIEILKDISEYSQEHFETEENYMLKFNYPGYQHHNAEHYDFFTKTITCFDRVVNGDYHISNKLIEYLKQWLDNHIQGSDRQYMDCFKKNGLK